MMRITASSPQADKDSALLTALRSGRLTHEIKSTIQELLDLGADINAMRSPPIEMNGIPDGATVTPLLFAYYLYENKKITDASIISFLLEKGANPNLGSSIGIGPLDWAFAHKQLAIAHLLLEKGATIKAELRILPLIDPLYFTTKAAFDVRSVVLPAWTRRRDAIRFWVLPVPEEDAGTGPEAHEPMADSALAKP